MHLFSIIFVATLLFMETTYSITKLIKRTPVGALLSFQNDPYGFF
jgi:hypothetical protein